MAQASIPRHCHRCSATRLYLTDSIGTEDIYACIYCGWVLYHNITSIEDERNTPVKREEIPQDTINTVKDQYHRLKVSIGKLSRLHDIPSSTIYRIVQE